MVEANLLAARIPGVGGEVFNIGGGEPRRHTSSRAGDILHTRADMSKAKQRLGYTPRVDFEKGFTRTVDYLRPPVLGSALHKEDDPTQTRVIPLARGLLEATGPHCP